MNFSYTAHKETASLISLVEKETGYRVTVGTTDADAADAEMISAAPAHPVHLINVSNRSMEMADYVVAVQCAMLLALWSHPEGVPEFKPIPDKMDYAVCKAANWRGLKKLAPAFAAKTAGSLIVGLLHQLRSTPAELMAMEYCWRECPGLRDRQTAAVTASLRRNTGNLRPEIREMAPPDIWKANQTICAALAQGWCDLTGEDALMLPYRAVGADASARKLVNLGWKTAGSPAERIVATVDAWAAELGLRTLYEWTFRKK